METRILITLAYTLTIIIGSIWIGRRHLSRRRLYLTMVGFITLLTLAVLNANYEFVEEKVASFISYSIHNGDSNSVAFRLQYYINLPALWLFNDPYSAHATNIAIQTFCFLLAFQYILPKKGVRWLEICILIYPAYYHYSIFGLRDPYINLIATVFVILAIKNKRSFVVIGGILLSFISLLARPEFSVILLSFVGLYFYLGLNKKHKLIVAMLYLCIIAVGANYLPYAFGVTPRGNISDNIEQIAEFNELRNARRIDSDGGGSAILGGRLFEYPLVVRYPIQVISSFISPLPFEIKSPVLFIGFMESLLFTWVAYTSWKKSKGSFNARYIFYCALLYMLLQAFFAMNYGNNLRIRYPSYIIFIGAISVGILERRSKVQANNLLFKKDMKESKG